MCACMYEDILRRMYTYECELHMDGRIWSVCVCVQMFNMNGQDYPRRYVTGY
jgi:hypothetical protein